MSYLLEQKIECCRRMNREDLDEYHFRKHSEVIAASEIKVGDIISFGEYGNTYYVRSIKDCFGFNSFELAVVQGKFIKTELNGNLTMHYSLVDLDNLELDSMRSIWSYTLMFANQTRRVTNNYIQVQCTMPFSMT
jgi:hypothetical protein